MATDPKLRDVTQQGAMSETADGKRPNVPDQWKELEDKFRSQAAAGDAKVIRAEPCEKHFFGGLVLVPRGTCRFNLSPATTSPEAGAVMDQAHVLATAAGGISNPDAGDPYAVWMEMTWRFEAQRFAALRFKSKINETGIHDMDVDGNLVRCRTETLQGVCAVSADLCLKLRHEAIREQLLNRPGGRQAAPSRTDAVSAAATPGPEAGRGTEAHPAQAPIADTAACAQVLKAEGAPAPIADTLAAEAAGAIVPELPVPTHDAAVANQTPTATWGDLKLVFVSDNEVNVFIRGKSHGAKNYEELGFVGKGGRPSQAWIVLRELSGNNGEPMRMGKDRAREIRKRLKAEFNMGGALLKFRKRDGHVPHFQIERSLAFGSGARQPLK